jgi:hypothetical protein
VRAVHVGEREPDARGDEHADGGERRRREPLEQPRGPRRGGAAPGQDDELGEAADPDARRELVERVERQEERARADPRRGVARPRGAGAERDHSDRLDEPAPAGARAAAADDRAAGEQQGAGDDARDGGVEVGGRGDLAHRPAGVARERGDVDSERQRLGDGDDHRARRGRGEAQPQERAERRARGERREQEPEPEDHAAHGDRLAAERETAQQDVDETGHALRPDAARRPPRGGAAGRSARRPW